MTRGKRRLPLPKLFSAIFDNADGVNRVVRKERAGAGDAVVREEGEGAEE
jgi:hypothetical protein